MLHGSGDGHGIAHFFEDIGAEFFRKGIIDSIEVHEACAHVRGILSTTVEFE